MKKLFHELLQSEAGATIDPFMLANHLLKRDLLAPDEYNLIKHKETRIDGQMTMFFQILLTKKEEDVMRCLIESATELRWEPMREFLETHKNRLNPNKFMLSNTDLETLVVALKEQYKSVCEIMRQQWSHFLDCGEEYAMKTSIQLEIIDEGRRSTKILHNYNKVFKNELCPPGSRIVLEGNPGMGKTTYLHKIALDWANNNDYWLNNRFDVVLLLRLGEVKQSSSLLEALAENYPPVIMNILQQMALHGSLLNKKVLLLLDGYDECNAINECPELKKLTQGQINFKAVVLISTRPSRTPELLPRNRLLLTNGFSFDKLQSLIRRDAKLSKFLQSNQMDEHFLKNPLVFGIFKAVNHAENMELFSLMNSFCDHLFFRHSKLKSDDQIDKTHKDDLFQFISKVAYQFHSDKPYSSPIDQVLLSEVAHIGVLWYQRKTCGLDLSYPETKELDPASWSFPHKLFQDFFAARFAHKDISFEDLKNANYDSTFLYFCSGFSPKFQQNLFYTTFGNYIRWDQNTLQRIPNPELIDASYVTNRMLSFDELEILGRGKPIASLLNVITEKITQIMKEKETKLRLLVLNNCLFLDWCTLIKIPAERLRIIDETIWDSKANTNDVAPLSTALSEFSCYSSLYSAEFRGPFVRFVIAQCNKLPELQQLTLWTDNNNPMTTDFASDITSLSEWVKRNQRLKELQISVDIRVPVTDFSNLLEAVAKRKVRLNIGHQLSRQELNDKYQQFLVQTMKARIKWNELDSFQRTMRMEEMKLCISEKAVQDTLESKEYVNSFILYGTDNDEDFMEFYQSEKQKHDQCNADYKFYFGNLCPPVRKWPRRERGDLEGICIALIPGAERYKINSQVDGQNLTILYPQVTWNIVQAIKKKLEQAAATVNVLRDEKVDPLTRDRSTVAYFAQQVELTEAFILIGVHFNVGHPSNVNIDTWSRDGGTYDMQWTNKWREKISNDICVYVPGSYMKKYDELNMEHNRFAFLHDIVSRKMEESLELAECITRTFRDKLAFLTRPIHTAAGRMAKEGIFHRNLGYLRASKCPACYCTIGTIDNIDQFKKLAAGDYQAIVDCYFNGILDYVARKNLCDL